MGLHHKDGPKPSTTEGEIAANNSNHHPDDVGQAGWDQISVIENLPCNSQRKPQSAAHNQTDDTKVPLESP